MLFVRSFVRSFVCLSEHFPLSDLHQIWNLTSLSGLDNCPVAANPAQVLQGVDPGGGILRRGGLTNWKFLSMPSTATMTTFSIKNSVRPVLACKKNRVKLGGIWFGIWLLIYYWWFRLFEGDARITIAEIITIYLITRTSDNYSMITKPLQWWV